MYLPSGAVDGRYKRTSAACCRLLSVDWRLLSSPSVSVNSQLNRGFIKMERDELVASFVQLSVDVNVFFGGTFHLLTLHVNGTSI